MSVMRTSPRFELARLALETALGNPDVCGASAGSGGMPVTASGGRRLEGVSAVAMPGGACAVGLRLDAKLVPLRALAEMLRGQIIEAVESSDIAAPVGSVDIEFAEIVVGAEA